MDRHAFLASVCIALLAVTADAHYHMLLPDKPSAKKGETVRLTCQFGHPYESQLFSMARPHKLVLISPDGKQTDKTSQLVKISLPGDKGKKVDGYRLDFTPTVRGDHVFVLLSAPTYLSADNQYIEDTTKVVVHVQTQKGLDASLSPDFEWSPLTRPYGLLPGTIFQAQIDVASGKKTTPLAGQIVEIERYNARAPRALPEDEFITRTVKTDRNGTVTTSLPQAGWWALTVSKPGRNVGRVNGKAVEIQPRSTFWVHVSHNAPHSTETAP